MDANIIPRLSALIVENARVSSHSSPAEVLQDLGTPTVSFAILQGDKVTAHCINDDCDDTETRFQACSISKPVAALAAFKLIEEKKLSLSASIAEYLLPSELAALETEATRGMAKKITISQLLSHTSGLEVHGFPGYDTFADSNGGRRAVVPTIREVLAGASPANTLSVRLADWPGHRYNYSGGGITLLQHVMETVTNKSFEQIMHEYVLGPLDLKNSTYQQPAPEDLNDYLHPHTQGTGNYARAHYTGFTPCSTPYHINPEQAAAGLWTTPADLLRVAAAVQSSYKSQPHRFMHPSTAKDMLREVQDDMAHSWFVGSRYFGHSGANDPGWRCFLLASLDAEKAVAVMTNSAEGTTAAAKIIAAICYFDGWSPPPEAWCHPSKIVPFADVHAALPSSEILEKWQGLWSAEKKNSTLIELSIVGGKPFIRMRDMPAVQLYVATHPKDKTIDGMTVVEDLVCKGGLEILVRLLEGQAGEIKLQLWNGNTNDRMLLRKVW